MTNLLKHLYAEFSQHMFDYLLFITVGVFVLLSLSIFQGERLIEFVIILAFVSFYIIWGIYHHIIANSLHFKVVLEYILIGFTLLFLIKILILP